MRKAHSCFIRKIEINKEGCNVMKNMSLEVIAKACNGTFHGTEEDKKKLVQGIVIDSRKAEKDFLFVAVKGERTDGHNYVSQVYEKGVAACLVEKVPEKEEGPYILVESSLQAVKDIAEYYRSILDIKVVGITGSVGKTSTKEMIASVLKQKYKVLKTEGNFNNEIGVPLTIFNIKEEHEVAVLEMGISDFGEMHRLSKMVKPDICVMTNIGLCHLENLKTRDGILKAKSEIFDFASPSCTAILNGDDDKLITLKSIKEIHPFFYGMKNENDIHAENIKDLNLEGIQCDICWNGQRVPVTIPIPGMHMVYNALAGAMVGITLGLSMKEIQEGIEVLKPTKGRNNILSIHNMTIIDDCYNANPVSMRRSIDVLSKASGRKVAVLGDMGELGENEEMLHYEIGEYAAEHNIDSLICVGALCEKMEQGALKAKTNMEVIHYKDVDTLLSNLLNHVKAGDTILVKASHFMQFEKVVKAFENS